MARNFSSFLAKLYLILCPHNQNIGAKTNCDAQQNTPKIANAVIRASLINKGANTVTKIIINNINMLHLAYNISATQLGYVCTVAKSQSGP